MLACFAAFPTTRYITIILVARLERSRTTPSHGREKRRTIQGWLTNHVVVSSCFFHIANFALFALFLLECFSARLVFFFSFFPQLRTIPAPRGGFSSFFFSYLLADVMPFPVFVVWLALRGRCRGVSFFPLAETKKVSRADVLAKGERGKL